VVAVLTAVAALVVIVQIAHPMARPAAPAGRFGAGSPAPAADTSRTPAPPARLAPPAQPATLASKLRTLPAGTGQVVIVHAPTAATTHATLETFDKVGNGWRRALAPVPARIGVDGFSDRHREGVPTTPVGMYSFGTTVYGINPNPGVHSAYHRIVDGDWWDENPSSPGYNTFRHGADPGGASEALWQVVPQYLYFAFITYNVPAKPGAGSGIFLHVGNGGPTLGCVSLGMPDLVDVLRWLDPAKHPRIVMAPDGELSRF